MLEKIAHHQLQEYLNPYKIIDQFQSGFRSYYSTETTSLKVTDDIRIGIDKQLVTLLLLFDTNSLIISLESNGHLQDCSNVDRLLFLQSDATSPHEKA